MSHNIITISDPDYSGWISALKSRYRSGQIQAAVKVNKEMLNFYWLLGKDMAEMHIEQRWGKSVIKSLSADLSREIPDAKCFSRTNLYYIKKFYILYSQLEENVHQVDGHFQEWILDSLFSVSWGHHMRLLDKFGNDPKQAFFYVRQTIENGWSRDMLLNQISSNLYARSGMAITNFDRTLPATTGELAQELTKDPYNFSFTGITERYNERLLKDKLLDNITQFLLELGTGFAYVGKEYRLKIGKREKFVDLLFYNLSLSCYVIVECKIGELDFQDIGQLGGYVVACNHLLKKEGRDNPTIGLLVCKEKDNLIAQYALESSSQPLGISSYELSKLYPEKVEGTIPTIEEIEQHLTKDISTDE